MTAITDWFLGFFGKAAHLILILTTLYTGAELLPGVSLPVAVNNSVFVVQMLVLDIGGMGLARLAMQARDTGNETGAAQAERLSRWLIRIVIASLVTVVIEQAVRAIPGLTGVASTVASINLVIGGALTIARAICAVHYGRVMHLLQEDESRPLPTVPVVRVEELVREAMGEIVTQIHAEQQQALAQVKQDIESHFPGIHEEAMLKAIRAEVQRQVPASPEPPGQLEAGGQSQESEPVAQRPEPPASTLALVLRPEPGVRATSASDARLQAASDLLVKCGERLSGRALAREAHVSRATASAWLAEKQSQHTEPEPADGDEVNGETEGATRA